MKPYGRCKNIKGSGRWKIDYHVHKKGFVNWWENICDVLPRSTMKRNMKKEIDKEINEMS